MARIKLAKWLYGLGLLAMPLSFAVKSLFDLVGITWVDPTLILGLIVFLLLRMPMKEKAPLWLVGFAFLSAFIGSFLMDASPDREKAALYIYYVEPIRLTLNIIWFWVSIHFLMTDRKFVIRWLAICVAWEFSIACYLYLAFFDLVPVPEAVKLYLDIYKTRQAVWWGDLPIYRMAGTFIEAPMFGLFMFCCLVVLVLALSNSRGKDDRRFSIWLRAGTICAFLGSVASLSDQTVVAIVILGLTFVLVRRGRSSAVRTLLWSSVIVGLVFYVASAEAGRWTRESYYSGDPMGTNINERLFHARYGLGLFAEQPASIITGIGPGRYGDYVVRTGFFPSTSRPLVAIIVWLVEYGILGLWLIGRWLLRIRSRVLSGYGTIGAGALTALLIANMFQGDWMWEAWFLALAFLYASAPGPTLEAAR
jgi:hypothetical protein